MTDHVAPIIKIVVVAAVTLGVATSLVSCSAPPRRNPPSIPSSSHAPSSTKPTPSSSPSAPLWATPRNGQPQNGARGTIILGSNGIPTDYIVAAGDYESGICERLGIFWWQMKDDHGTYLGTNAYLSAGERLAIIEGTEDDALAAGAESTNPTCT